MSDVNDPKTIEDLSETELEELIAAGRLSDDGEILPAESEEGEEAEGTAGSEEEGGGGDSDATGEEGESADKAKPKADPVAEGTKAGDEADNAGSTEQDPEKVMIPKARLDREIQHRRKLEEERAAAERELAFLKGRDSVHKERSDAKPDEAGAQPKTAEQIEAEIDNIWKQVDDGELTLSEARKLERAKEAEIEELKKPHKPEAKREPDASDQTSVEYQIDREAQRVAAEHPYINTMSEADLAYCSAKVDEQIRAEGIQMPRNPISAAVMRMELIGKMTTKLGPGLTGKDLSPKPADKTPPPLTEDQKRQAAKVKAEERSEKIKTAAQQPPNSSATGTATGGFGEMTPDRFENLSESEREALPPAVLDRLLNS